MGTPQRIVELVERFDRDAAAYRSGGYNETQLRREFLDPFFAELGWDIDNRKGAAEVFKEVVHEHAVRIDGRTKKPDYCFRIAGREKFYLEAKKPAVNIGQAVSPAYQLRRYAWNAKLPLSILSDFEETAVYDTRVRPDSNDKPSTARILHLKYTDYPSRWEEVADLFSREAVSNGSIEQLSEAQKGRRGTQTVDAVFLREIEAWRGMLADNLASRNELTPRQLNYAVQMTIDRIIFLRICEDRGIERYEQLKEVAAGGGVYGSLVQLFHRADEKYTSGLLHFRHEKDEPEGPDALTPQLVVDDGPLEEIVRNLYEPYSPYLFSVLPADVLGQVYERFLGKVIRLTSEHKAVIEEKPEVKKAGGVYYTPTYIVDYIVGETVGKLCEGKTARQVSPLRILDPACGSGSFLLGAYQFLLNWYLDWYIRDGAEKHKKRLYKDDRDAWQLTTAERKRILLQHVYGVDIDPQAVEVTKLSLLLKVLEGESAETISSQLRIFQERALPDLGANIKCGNSLVGTDFYDDPQMNLLSEEDVCRVNAFDWRVEFSEVMASGGFHAVIGNPPYLYSAGRLFANYFSGRYKLSQYQTDYYVYFVERSLELARAGGKFSFIVSDSWLNSQNFSKVRGHLLDEHKVDLIAVFDYPVFAKVTLENSIFVVTVSGAPDTIPVERFSKPNRHSLVNRVDPSDAVARGMIDPRLSLVSRQVIQKIEEGSYPLERVVKLNRGIHAYRTDGYGKSKFGAGVQTKRDKDEESYHADRKVDGTYLPELKGKHVDRFAFTPAGKYLSYGSWLAEPREPDFFLKPKITVRKILGRRLHGTFIEEPTALDQSLYVLISKRDDPSELKHILGVLLSRIGAWYLRTKHSIYDALYPWYTKKQLAAFPVKDKDDRVVALVEQMLSLHEQLASALTSHEKNLIRRRIDAQDRQIDQRVYELYGLTEGEVGIIEEGL